MFALKSRQVIKITGSNTISFLQGLITADLLSLKQGSFLFSAFLNSKSRFLYDFFIFLNQDEVLIDINSNFAQNFIQSIKYYDLLEEYTLTIESTLKVFASEEFLQNWKNGKFLGRFLLQNTPSNCIDEEVYNLERIKLCLPDGYNELTSEKSIILDYGYEEAHAISFTKGCYIGQELITRTKRVGEVRKGLCCVKINKTFFLEETKSIKVLSKFQNYALLFMYKKDYLNRKIIQTNGLQLEVILYIN